MLTSLSGFTAAVIYLGGFIYLLRQLIKGPDFNLPLLKMMATVALVLHGLSTTRLLFSAICLDLSLL